jgi:hypothetical protein
MKKYLLVVIFTLTLTGCPPRPDPIVKYVVVKEGYTPKQKPAPAGVVGTWHGSSYGESIVLKFGSNGSAILNNDAGSNSGSWSSQGSGSYSVNIAGQSGRMVLLNPSTASLNIGGSSIELRRN